MKKILMAGALAASMLASSAAFAADLTVGVSEDKLTVTADTDAIMTANAGKQMTVVVVDGNGSTVSTDTIRYIDQDEAKAGLFESMGVLLRATKDVDAEGNPIMETALPVGTYTVKIGGEDITDLYVGTLEVEAESTGTKVSFVFGDVNNGAYVDGATAMDSVDASDALAVLKASVGGSKTQGGIANIGDVLTTEAGVKFVFADVNNGAYVDGATAMDSVDASDALALLKASVGGSKTQGGIANIGDVVTVVIAE